MDLILIEPSGVGKLSDIIAACQSAELADTLSLRQCVTVVDVQRCALYLRNFGEFYKDQISHSQVVFLSHVDENPQAVTAAEAAVRTYNPPASNCPVRLCKTRLAIRTGLMIMRLLL